MFKEVKVQQTLNHEEGFNDEKELYNSVVQHKENVNNVMLMLAEHVQSIGEFHDWTKIEFFNEFQSDVKERTNNPNFTERDWSNIHCNYERHHLNACVPNDVDLFDVLEMLVDCIVSGKTREGSVNKEFLELKDDILENAYWNTFNKLNDKIIVE